MKKIYLVPAVLTLLSSCSWWGDEEINLTKEQRQPVNITNQDMAQIQPPFNAGGGMPPQMMQMNDYQMPQGMSAPQMGGMPPMQQMPSPEMMMQQQMGGQMMQPQQMPPMQGGFMDMSQNPYAMQQMQQPQFAPQTPQEFTMPPAAQPQYNYNPWQQQEQRAEQLSAQPGNWSNAEIKPPARTTSAAPTSLNERYENPLNRAQRNSGYPQVIPAPPKEQLYRFDAARQTYVPAN